MTQTEEIATTVEAKTTSDQMNEHSMAANDQARDPELSSSSGIHEEEPPVAATGSIVEMGSTDSAGTTASGPSSCGLVVGSLFPSSCRGRAEAFARRLHHRLTSLGGDDDDVVSSRKETCCEPSKPSETSWLHSNATTTASTASRNHVLARQPRHSSDSDLYFDFDIDEDAPGSPAEEATDVELANLLVNPEILKARSPTASRPTAAVHLQDPESGCVFSSPVTGTSPESDSSDAYLDPVSSGMDKTGRDSFYDPATCTTSSDSDASILTNGSADPAKMASNAHRHPVAPRPEWTPMSSESSESADKARGSRKDRHFLDREEPVRGQNCSSEDSSNGRSSLDTTSPSRESLWSTFDDSTLSLQDNSPSRTGVAPTTIVAANRVRKSHSDSEIPANRRRSDDCKLMQARSGDVPLDEVDEVGFANGVLEKNTENLSRNLLDLSLDRKLAEMDRRELDDSMVRASVRNLKDIITSSPQFRSNDDGSTSDTDTDHSTYSSTIDISRPLTLECSTGTRVMATEEIVKNEVRLQIENGTVTNGSGEDKEEEEGEWEGEGEKKEKKKKTTELMKRLGSDAKQEMEVTVGKANAVDKEERKAKEKEEKKEEEEEEEEEEEDDRPQRVRRCSSLKTGKTPPGTPGRKKIVRFADVLGLDLADVRTFLDEIPKIPNSAYSDLVYDDTVKDPPIHQQTWNARYQGNRDRNKPDRMLVPLFQQPGGLTNFLDIVRERQVCLENVLVQDPIALCLQGTVRVRNLDFHKSVHIRYTLNAWQTFSDLQATYVANSCDGFSDKFAFALYCHTLRIGQRLEFAVRFQCKGAQFWDSNGGANYSFQCLPTAPTVGYIPITSASETTAPDWSPTFY